MRLCKECGVREVAGCRCNIGANYCTECKPAHFKGPFKSVEEWSKEYAKQHAKTLFEDIEQKVLDELKNPDNRLI